MHPAEVEKQTAVPFVSPNAGIDLVGNELFNDPEESLPTKFQVTELVSQKDV